MTTNLVDTLPFRLALISALIPYADEVIIRKKSITISVMTSSGEIKTNAGTTIINNAIAPMIKTNR